MKLNWQNLTILTLMLGLISFTNVLAQFEDDMLGEEETEEVACVPENLTTVWDSLANKELDQDIRLLYNFGYEYYKNKSYKEALPYLWKVYIKNKGKYGKAAVRKIANIYFNQGQVDSTLLICYRGLQDYPDIILLHHYAGLLQNKLGRYKCAIPHFEKLVESDSTNLTYLKTLSFLYFRDENEEAMAIQEKVVALDPNNSEAVNTLAQYANHFYGEGEEYLKFRRDAYNSDPTNMDLALKYGEAASKLGEFKEALIPLNKVIEKKPGKKAYLLRAEVYENLNQNNNAIKDYKSALKESPKDVNVMLRIAENYKFINNFSSARYWVKKTLQAKPGYGAAYITMGEIYEATVPYCQKQLGRKETKYEDKLVYKKAYNEYQKAKKDQAFVSIARKKQENLKPFLPTQEDKFMHQKDKIESSCYDWLK